MERDTVGKISTDLLKNQPDSQDPIEIEREAHKDYEKNVYETIEYGKKQYLDDFYVVVITKNERLLQNVFRNYFLTRHSCPTPDFDQTVYKYSYKEQRADFLWVIPSKDACIYLAENANQVAPEERMLLNFVILFTNGTLDKYAKKLNKEQPNSNIIEA